jgi:hypothetical protein
VKIHVRDEYMKPTPKENLKRYFGPPIAVPTNPISAAGDGPSVQSVPEPTTFTPPSEPQQPSSSTPSGNRNNSFTELMNQHIRSVEEDNQDNEPVRISATLPLMPLSNLFDIASTHWATLYQSHVRYSYDEELALYELLELDADGEEDPEFDDTIHDILVN